MSLEFTDLIKLIAAIVVGGLIGAEREFRDKAAGFRTLIFICVGAALFTIFSVSLSDRGDPGRIAAQVVTGIGFLGAGAILREGSRVVGLTTAASIWVVAALGMGIGVGQYGLVAAAVAAVLLVLWVFPFIEYLIDRARETRTYEVVWGLDRAKFERLEEQFRQHGLAVKSHKQVKEADGMRGVWEARGSVAQHDRVTSALLRDPEVRELRY